MSSWEHASSRLGRIQPATRSIAKEIYDVAAANGHEIWFMWGIGSSSEHATGRALDLMVRNQAAGDFIRDYVWRNRRRLRLRHVIWWQRITSTVVRPGVVRLMRDRGNATANHKDHPHIFFNPGAYQAPPASSTPPPATPPPSTLAASKVVKIQRALKVTADGKWGPITDTLALRMRVASRAKRGWPSNLPGSFHVTSVQSTITTSPDGIWGPISQAALTRWIRNFQDILDVKVDGLWGPRTDSAFMSVRKRYLNNY